MQWEQILWHLFLYGLVIIIEIFKNIKTIKSHIKKYQQIILSIISLPIAIYCMYFLCAYIVKFMCVPSNISQRLLESINYFLLPLLYGPNFIKNAIYFVQLKQFEYGILILYLIFVAFALIRIYRKQKKEYCKC